MDSDEETEMVLDTADGLRALLVHGAPLATTDDIRRQLRTRPNGTPAADVVNDEDFHQGIIHLAIATGSLDIVNVLLEQGADVLRNYTRSGLNGVQYAALYASPLMVGTVLTAAPDDEPDLFALVRYTSLGDFFGELACDCWCEYKPRRAGWRRHTPGERVAIIHLVLDKVERRVPPECARDWLLQSVRNAYENPSGFDVIPEAVAALRRRHAMQVMRRSSCRWLHRVSLQTTATVG